MNVPEVAARAVPAGAYLLDVREDEEWRAGHAPGATHIPLQQLGLRIGELPASGPIYVVCRVGARSAMAAAWLNRSGRDATNVEGGMNAWAAAGLPMVSEDGRDPFVA